MPRPKNNFNPNEAAKKFISGAAPADSPSEPNEKPKLMNRAYYIRPEQHKRVKLYAVENDTDASSIIRAAIDMFLEKYDTK